MLQPGYLGLNHYFYQVYPIPSQFLSKIFVSHSSRIFVFATACWISSFAKATADKRVVGAFGDGVHLFPFRTEQLSPSAPMVLGQMSRESRSVPTQFNKMPRSLRTSGHFCLYPLPYPIVFQQSEEVAGEYLLVD